MIFQQYSNIFGLPGQGLHQYRICDAALIDYALTIISAIIICKFTKIPLVICTVFLFIFGMFMHYLFGVNTSSIQWWKKKFMHT